MRNHATVLSEQRLALLGQALAHPARIRILAQGERCGCELAPLVGLDPSVVSRHLGLVTSRREGVRVFWKLSGLEVLLALTCLQELHCFQEAVHQGG